jgi:excisionase family DNA binding protein
MRECNNLCRGGKMQTKEQYPIFLTVKHVAEILGVGIKKAYEVTEQKGFPLVRIGRLKRVNRDAFFQWIENKSNEELCEVKETREWTNDELEYLVRFYEHDGASSIAYALERSSKEVTEKWNELKKSEQIELYKKHNRYS